MGAGDDIAATAPAPAAGHDDTIAGPPGAAAPERFARGDSFEHFVVLDRLGEGGMGLVLAAYDLDLNRKVAIKVLRRTSREHRERLLREARAMAQLSHPNVVSVYEVGEVDGEVFVAMEHLAGGTVGQWLRTGERSWHEVVELFREAGRGLAAAHAAGLVHRDFKPDNLLLGEDGRARVSDFGLVGAAASAASVESGASPLGASLTVTGALMGTPAYMAPEQHEGRAADARADQFSFCVALYEALYGVRPFAGDTLRELASNVVAGKLTAPPAGAVVPAWVRRVVVQGLAADPESRHASMDALLAALGRDPRVSRRRWILTGAVFAALAALGVSLWSAGRRRGQMCLGAERKLAAVWDAGVKEDVRAAFAATGKPYADDAWRGVESRLDGYAASWVAMHREACEATRLRGEQSEDLLDRRMQCLDRRLEETRALTALFSRADAEVAESAVAAAERLGALADCSDAALLLARLPPPPEAIAAQVREVRVALGAATALLAAGKYAEAKQAAARVQAEAAATRYAPLLAEVELVVGQAADKLGELEPARAALFRAAVEASAASYDEVAADAWAELVDLIGVEQARTEEALQWSEVARAAVARLGAPPARQAAFLASRGNVHHYSGKYDQAIADYRAALVILEPLQANHQLDIAGLHNDLGNSTGRQGDAATAEKELAEALAIKERVLGPAHPDVALSLRNLGVILEDQGRYEEALQRYERALQIELRALGPEHRSVGVTYHDLGSVLEELSRYDEAAAAYEKSLAIEERVFGPKHPRVASTLANIGGLYMRRGDYARAEPYLRRSLAIDIEVRGAEHAEVAPTYFNLGMLKLKQHRLAEAEENLTRARAIAERALGADHPEVASTLNGLGDLYAEKRDLARAEASYRRALAIRAQLGPDHPSRGITLWSLGNLYRANHRYEQAEHSYRAALAVWEKALGPRHSRVALALVGLGLTYVDSGRPGLALPLLERAVTIQEAAGIEGELALGRFALARALWDARTDRARALVLAREAEVGFSRVPSAVTRRAEVAAWLRSHAKESRRVRL